MTLRTAPLGGEDERSGAERPEAIQGSHNAGDAEGVEQLFEQYETAVEKAGAALENRVHALKGRHRSEFDALTKEIAEGRGKTDAEVSILHEKQVAEIMELYITSMRVARLHVDAGRDASSVLNAMADIADMMPRDDHRKPLAWCEAMRMHGELTDDPFSQRARAALQEYGTNPKWRKIILTEVAEIGETEESLFGSRSEEGPEGDVQ